MKKYKNLVFDIDGTLLDTEQAVIQSLYRALHEVGIEEKLEDLRFALGIPGFSAIKRYELADPKQVLHNWDRYFLDYRDKITIFNGIVETLELLKSKSISLGVVTSKNDIELAQDFGQMGLSQYFDIIITANATKTHKPEAGPLLRYLELSHAKASETIYIGDAEADMLCASNAGCDSALALWGRSDTGHLQSTLRLAQPEDILQLIL